MWPGLSTTLSGERVVLEPLAERHRDGLRAAAHAAGAETFRWMPAALHEPAPFDLWFDERLRLLAGGIELAFATLEQPGGTPLGSSSFLALRPEHRGLEIGWTWLTPAVWQTGANVEAKLLMLGHAFETAGCLRVELKTDARNERSRGAIGALPAQFEGIHRQHMVRPDGSLRDSAYYSVLDREWPAVRANLVRRLAVHGGS
ncbi:MAG: family acetyltransferase [Conexibacter sp.]|jgi:N-acetyltransferase|nr:family acetyltransferase [Conexibacter sp.]